MFFEILLEGEADVPAVKAILSKRFNLVEGMDYRIHPHQGKGVLPADLHRNPDPRKRGLLDQLPAKLRGYSYLSHDFTVIVLVDSDNESCIELKNRLVEAYDQLDKKPSNVLFRIVVEETETWFLADREAIRAAYPRAKVHKLPDPPFERPLGAWERLAEVLGREPKECDGSDKYDWAFHIAPHLDVQAPKAQSLNSLITGVKRFLEKETTS